MSIGLIKENVNHVLWIPNKSDILDHLNNKNEVFPKLLGKESSRPQIHNNKIDLLSRLWSVELKIF